MDRITDWNFRQACIALTAQCVGNNVVFPGGEELTICEEPLIGFASAEDALFARYKRQEVIGPLFWGPLVCPEV